jgi:regulator of sigma D
MTQKLDANEKQAQAADRRRRTQDGLAKMIAERTEMFALYWRLAGLNTSTGEHRHEPVQKLLQEFCQILVDYIAAGHFSLYERIVNGTERRREVATLASELYPRIAETTQLALDFNDKYDCGENGVVPDSFQKDLSRLGEELAVRIELEDKLISRLIV